MSVVILSVEVLYTRVLKLINDTECRYTQCRYSESRGAIYRWCFFATLAQTFLQNFFQFFFAKCLFKKLQNYLRHTTVDQNKLERFSPRKIF